MARPAPLQQSSDLNRPRLSDWQAAVNSVFWGKPEVITQALTTLFAGGHLLIEDVPGVGKTTLALTLAKLIGCSFQRIQCTSDLMPSDFIGISILNPQTQTFEFRPGPLFHQVVLVDELNRATPRTQSALLESMSERQISLDNQTFPLPNPFFLVATQNPFEQHGVFALPESQLDRFMMRLSIGYPTREEESRILRSHDQGQQPLDQLTALCGPTDLLQWMQQAVQTHVAPPVDAYILDIADATRHAPEFLLGVSPRGALALRQAVQAYAFLNGRDYALADDVKALAVSVLAHRIQLASPALQGQRLQAEDLLRRLIDRTPIPL